MKAKIVYVLASGIDDIYMEQLWVSATSLRLHNPNVWISVLMDGETRENLTGYRAQLLSLIDEIIVIDVPECYSQKEISRFIKTSVRQWIKGDFLFIDTDTVIAGDLSGINDLCHDIMLCPEYHSLFADCPNRNIVLDKVKNIFSIDVANALYYYNSGVIFCRDTPFAHEFYKKWNENWAFSAKNCKVVQDQPALMKTNHDFHYAIKNLDGKYHCQIFASMKYLHQAKIIHFFNVKWFKTSTISPFIGEKLYREIKKKQSLDSKTLDMINDVKSQFTPISVIVGREEYDLLNAYGKDFTDILLNSDTKLKKICRKLIHLVLFIFKKLN